MKYELPNSFHAMQWQHEMYTAGRLAGLEEAAMECDLLATSVSNDNFIAKNNREICADAIRNLASNAGVER